MPRKVKVLSDKPTKTGRKWEYREVILDTPGWEVDRLWDFGPACATSNGKTRLILRRPIQTKTSEAAG